MLQESKFSQGERTLEEEVQKNRASYKNNLLICSNSEGERKRLFFFYLLFPMQEGGRSDGIPSSVH